MTPEEHVKATMRNCAKLAAEADRARRAWREDLDKREKCRRALHCLAGNGFITPAEGYGADTVWAMNDLMTALNEAMERLRQRG